MRRCLTALLALAGVALVEGCGVECTLLACEDALLLVVRSREGALTAGRYEVRVVAAGLERRLECVIDGGALKGCGESSMEFMGHVQDGALHLQVSGTPDPVEVTVSRDDVLLETFDVSASYDEVHPNGPECGGGCRQGRATLEL